MSEMTPHAEGAAPYALTIRRILECPIAWDPAQEIVYRGRLRLTYADLRARVHRLAGALAALGVRRGDTVAVLDWDSHRYLEAFFAVPMMGAVLHTVNVRLSPEQILYTVEHAEDDVVLVHADFLPILEAIRGRISTVKRYVVLTDDAPPASATIPIAGEYEALLAAAPARFDFPELPEDTRATTFYTTGTTGLPKVGGEWLSSLEVEDALAAHPAVAEVAVIGVADAKWGEKPLALVVRKPGHEGATEKDLQRHAREYVDKGVLPRLVVTLHVKFVEAIERTSVGKVNKRALRERHGG